MGFYSKIFFSCLAVIAVAFAYWLYWGWLHGHAETEQARIDLFYKAIGGLIVAATSFFGLRTYMENKRLERIKWLSQLHDKFFIEDKYSEMRILLDYKTPVKDYEILKDCFPDKTNNSNCELQEQLVSYLNFFEFIATLKKERQLTLSQIRLVFGYYIFRIDEHPWLKSSLQEYKFRNLPALIEEIGRAENRIGK